jgi:Ca2+-binding EF-hand superfamily protein
MSRARLPITVTASISPPNGTILLQEFEEAHERIFKSMDEDKDGTVTLDEMQAFIHGGR